MSETQFDPYRKWLGIHPKDQPPNHYRLLGLELFEDDVDVIEVHANKQMAYLHGCSTGEYAEEAERLLNEIAGARLCLIGSETKRVYDAQLKSKSSSNPSEVVSSVRPRRRKESHRPEQIRRVVATVVEEIDESRWEPNTRRSVVRNRQRQKRSRKRLWGMFGGGLMLVLVVLGFMPRGGDDLAEPTSTGDPTDNDASVGTNDLSAISGTNAGLRSAGLHKFEKDNTTSPSLRELDNNDSKSTGPRARLLAGLDAANVKVGAAGMFSQKGEWGRAPLLFDWNRVPGPNSIFMHPGKNTFSRVVFKLDRPYRTLKTAAAIPQRLSQHEVRRQGNSATPLVFSVLGDGRTLWKSEPLSRKGAYVKVEVSLEGISLLQLRVNCPGANNWAVAAWHDPILEFD